MGPSLLAAAAIVTLVLGLEIVARATRLPKALMRKLAHVGMSLLLVGLANVLDYRIFIVLGVLFAVGMLLLHRFYPLQTLTDRAHASYGEVFFPLGVSTAALFAATTTQFIVTILILGLADTAAYVVGRYLSSPRLIFGKTLLGSAAFFIVTLCCLWVLPVPLAHTLALASLLTICELFSPYGSDNLTIPVVAAVALAYVA